MSSDNSCNNVKEQVEMFNAEQKARNEKFIQTIKECIAKSIYQQLISRKKYSEGMEKIIATNVSSILKSLDGHDLSQPIGVVESVKRLWATWNWKRKAKWFVLMRIGIGRKEYKRYLEYENKFYCSLSNLAHQFIEDSDEAYEAISDYLEAFKSKFEKWWYQPAPKLVMICDLKLNPIHPISFVKIEGKIDL